MGRHALVRHALVGLVGAGVVALAGCNSYQDTDFTTRCAGSFSFRGINADATREVVVHVPDAWISEAEGADADIVHTVALPSATVGVDFVVGSDLDEINLDYCFDDQAPPDPAVTSTLAPTSGEVEIVLHPADYWRNVTGDVHLDLTRFSDGSTTVTVAGFSMVDAPVAKSG